MEVSEHLLVPAALTPAKIRARLDASGVERYVIPQGIEPDSCQTLTILTILTELSRLDRCLKDSGTQCFIVIPTYGQISTVNLH